VRLSQDGQVPRIHPIGHDRSREPGALANPQGRPAASTPPSAKSPTRPGQSHHRDHPHDRGVPGAADHHRRAAVLGNM